MIAVLCIVGWLTVGLGVVALCLWVEVFDFKFSKYDDDLDGMAVVVCTVTWPITMFAAIGTVVLRATMKAKERRTAIREEMEREARKAAKEVEDFLRSTR